MYHYIYPCLIIHTLINPSTLCYITLGKITALVGPSGAGKSTIAALLNGFYDPSKGVLLVNGLSRSSVLKDQYLSQVSMVRQTPALFTDTVASNIAYGAVAYRSVTRDEIIQAAKQVIIHCYMYHYIG